MKSRNILLALSALLIGGLSSCDKLLDVDSKVVVYEKDNTLSHVTDTVYTVLGIEKQLQKIADRTVLLGELRGDLVSLTDDASDNIREIYKYDFANLSDKNIYNQVVDYYSVINNCNYFLSKVDTSYIRDGQYIFVKEYAAVLSFRAWTYLQLAQVYGKVPFVTEPVLSADAKLSDFPLLGIKDIAKELIDDLLPFVDTKFPNYGELGGAANGDGTSAEKHTSQKLFIPVRLILGDLYLWSEQPAEAAKYYHDFLSNDAKYEYTPTSVACATWKDLDFIEFADDTYASRFSKNDFDDNVIAYIAMESQEYNGVMSQLPDIFGSTKKNDYYHQVYYSKALSSLSASQKYAYHDITTSGNDILNYVRPEFQESDLTKGDLRLHSILSEKTVSDKESSILSEKRVENRKFNKTDRGNQVPLEKISLYRYDVIYLRLAEALNRAGLPEVAFAILKQGLAYDDKTLDYTYSSSIAKANELDLLSAITFPSSYFRIAQWVRPDRNSTKITFEDPTNYNTFGIHSRGCGDASMDTTYVIPECATLQDSIRAVEELIINEMALETCFEGYRFGDLLRVAQHRGAETGTDYDTEFFAKHVASRGSAYNDDTDANFDNTLYNTLKSDSKNWFLPLPKEN